MVVFCRVAEQVTPDQKMLAVPPTFEHARAPTRRRRNGRRKQVGDGPIAVSADQDTRGPTIGTHVNFDHRRIFRHQRHVFLRPQIGTRQG